jgi:hypothetical protein
MINAYARTFSIRKLVRQAAIKPKPAPALKPGKIFPSIALRWSPWLRRTSANTAR